MNLKVALVTGNLFSVLGVTPLLGRNLQAQDDSIAAAPVVAISYELWQRRYGRESVGAGSRAHDSRAARHDRRGDASRLCISRPDGRVGDGASVPPHRGAGPPDSTCTGRTARAWRNGRTSPQPSSQNYLRSNYALLPTSLRGA